MRSRTVLPSVGMLVAESAQAKGLFDLSLRAREESLPADAETDQPLGDVLEDQLSLAWRAVQTITRLLADTSEPYRVVPRFRTRSCSQYVQKQLDRQRAAAAAAAAK